ncbi:Jag N-terminal domain-containing protein [Desulfopila sp. IMCC35008]|uniref:Jag family protein n=1 Tax=Desulfopila sp. IMCC35008 TaxID=2653858 RepID=UPI0013CF6D76|nr:Jag N-terminal domain-containing protein [Desulfopila sp. IMCC35008]
MSEEKHDFYGKEVTDAIKKAVDTLKVPQEQLDIEVLETGSTGIFGLIRKKAKIRVKLQDDTSKGAVQADEPVEVKPVPEAPKKRPRKKQAPKPEKKMDKVEEKVVEVEQKEVDTIEETIKEKEPEQPPAVVEEEVNVSDESIAIVKQDLAKMLELMGYGSSIEVIADGLTIQCHISDEFQKELSGPEGKTLDSIQYLIRKISARKCAERLRINVDVGNFREQRLEELKERAVTLASQVKEDGKTQVLPALNPSERREIHMVLQEDKEVRSRSVGEGLFKKILIYKPGKTTRGGGGGGGGRKKSGPRNGNRRGRPPRNSKPKTNEE